MSGFPTFPPGKGSGGGGSSSDSPSTSALTNVTVSTMPTALLAANPNRVIFAVKNDGAQALYIAYAATASTTSYTVDLEPGGSFVDETGWLGAVSAVTASSTSTARVTELTP